MDDPRRHHAPSRNHLDDEDDEDGRSEREKLEDGCPRCGGDMGPITKDYEKYIDADDEDEQEICRSCWKEIDTKKSRKHVEVTSEVARKQADDPEEFVRYFVGTIGYKHGDSKEDYDERIQQRERDDE